MNKLAYFKLWTKDLFKKGKICTDKKNSIFDIDFNSLKGEGIELVIFDFDDTLSGFHDDLSKEVIQLLKSLPSKKALLSNFPKERGNILISEFSDNEIDIFIALESDKPGVKGFESIKRHFGIESEKIAMIGERLGTDIYGAYRAGIKKRILVKPYSEIFSGTKAPFGIRFFRKIEELIWG